MFPRPTSSRTLVRRTLSASIEELGHIFAGEVEAFLAEEARARRGHYEKVVFVGEDADEDKVSPKERRVRKIAKRALAVTVCVDNGHLVQGFGSSVIVSALSGTASGSRTISADGEIRASNPVCVLVLDLHG